MSVPLKEAGAQHSQSSGGMPVIGPMIYNLTLGLGLVHDIC
jgi:hypothetical protein